VAEGLAGLDAIAAGRAFDSDLVRAVVAAIYAENEGP
jgi:predicted transcriptional regulator